MIILMGIGTDSSSAVPVSYVPGEILVKFRSGTPPETIENFGVRMKTSVKRKSDLTGVQLLSLPSHLSVEEALGAYRNHPDVLYAEPNYIRRAFVSGSDLCLNDGIPNDPCPNDPFFDQQWGLHNTGQTINTLPQFRGGSGADIEAPSAWDITIGIAQIVIAVIDSGVDYTHPDFGPSGSSNIWANSGDSWSNTQNPSTGNGLDDDGNGYTDDFHGWNFVGNQTCTVDANNNCNCTPDDPVGNNDPMDDFGHGTHVAGIIAAKGNDGTGVTGVLWTAQIMPLKILDANGCGSVGDEIQAIDYAINNGAKIINASFGGSGLSSSEEDAIRAANNAGVVFVAAAGNESSNDDNFPIYPASFNLPNVISVAATDWNDQLSSVSNFGKNTVDIAAPGDCVYSTTPQGPFTLLGAISCLNTPITSGHAYLTGTSMATPHVSGVAGLLLSQDPSLTPEEVRAVILLSADPVDALQGRVASSGRLNASSALRRAKGSGLIGGSGGCGFPIGTVRPSNSNPAASDPVPPVQVLLFLLVLFWPLLIPILRKKFGTRVDSDRAIINRGPGMASAAGLLVLVFLCPQTVTATDEDRAFQPAHSLALKLGYHRYSQSDYLDTNSGLISRNDLAGWSEELEYDWQWRKDISLSVTAGRYQSDTDLKNLCCDRLKFTTMYLLLTPKYHSSIGSKDHSSVGSLEWYVGGGVGYYHFSRKINGLIEDNLSANLLGLHAVIGLEWLVLKRVSVFTEARYALAKVKSADAFDDALDVGGLNYSLGVRWWFLPVQKPS
ncbi:MAG: S8 family serine peptidase [Nitrospirae bacterium]|nr:S8 family serine peptidase [Nitrospirota bacterium]